MSKDNGSRRGAISHRQAALDALTLLIQKLDGLETSPTVRYAMADALTARDEVTQIVEQTRPRRAKKEATT